MMATKTCLPRATPLSRAVASNLHIARPKSYISLRCACKPDGRCSSKDGEIEETSSFVDPVEHSLDVREQPAKRETPGMLFTTLIAAGMGGIMGMLPDLNGPISTLQAIGILAGIVAFHELGHFTAARVQGIHVSKFSIGFGPSLLSTKVGEVEYSLRAFPLGGFVAFPDNDEDCPYPEDDPDLLKNRPILDRFWVISAGVIFNVILAFMVTVAQVQDIGYMNMTYNPGVRLPIIMKGGAAEKYGLLPGDVVLALDDKPVPTGPNAVSTVVQSIKNSRDLSIDFTVARPGGVEHVQVLPDIGSDGKGKIGVQLAGNVDIVRQKAEGVVELFVRSGEEVGRLLVATADGLKGLIGNFDAAKESVSSPVAVVAVGSQVARQSPAGLYSFAAVVNVNLAVVNVLPIPALDGGYLLLLLVELIRRGKKLPQEVEATFMASGFLLLTGLGIFLILKDTLSFLQ